MPNKEPIRCFEGNAKPHEPFWTFRNAADGSEPELELYGYISEYSWFDDDVTPKKFRDDLNKFGQGGPITVRMNSYGGDVIAASVMNTIIREYPGRVTVQVDGIAASAATVVAVAGDVIRMQETAYFMIHDPLAIFFMAMMNIEEMSRMLDSLKTVKEGIVNAYETKTGMSRTRLSTLMSNETWMDAQKALDLGFIDEIIRGETKQLDIPENAAVVNAIRRNYVNVPEFLLQQRQQEEPETSTPEPSGEHQQAMDKLRAEAKFLRG